MSEEKKELKEKDIEKVSGGIVREPIEDKELKDEDLNKVSGGAKEYYAFCEDCNRPVDSYYDPNINNLRCKICHGTKVIVIAD